jgi:hypothetical protein
MLVVIVASAAGDDDGSADVPPPPPPTGFAPSGQSDTSSEGGNCPCPLHNSPLAEFKSSELPD